jgi:hypothetical protein
MDNEARAAPKFDVMPIDKARGLLDGFGIVGANQRVEPNEMPVAPDGVGAVLCHPDCPHYRLVNSIKDCQIAKGALNLSVDGKGQYQNARWNNSGFPAFQELVGRRADVPLLLVGPRSDPGPYF